MLGIDRFSDPPPLVEDLSAHLRLLCAVLTTFGIDPSACNVMDTCYSNGGLTYFLMELFRTVGSNCPSSASKNTPNHFHLSDAQLWRRMACYDGIVTRVTDPRERETIFMHLRLPDGPYFAALLVPSSFPTTKNAYGIDFEVLGFSCKWQIIFDHHRFKVKYEVRSLTLPSEVLGVPDTVESIVSQKIRLEQIYILRKKRRFNVQDGEAFDKATGESLFYQEAKILKSLTEGNSFKRSKKKFIALLCNESYRSVQRKIRIATLAIAIPELRKMNLREAEEHLKNSLATSL